MSLSEGVRKEMASLCENSKTRGVAIKLPNRWRPGEVVNPETGSLALGFSDSSAWAFIAQLIRDGCAIDQITLDIPKGKTGYVIKHQMPCGRYLYIKVMFGSGRIFGRSFHYSEHTFDSPVIN